MKQLSVHFDVFERLRHWRVIFGDEVIFLFYALKEVPKMHSKFRRTKYQFLMRKVILSQYYYKETTMF